MHVYKYICHVSVYVYMCVYMYAMYACMYVYVWNNNCNFYTTPNIDTSLYRQETFSIRNFSPLITLRL